jgi:hypothetical protein
MDWYNNIEIKMRLLSAFLVMSIITALVGFIGINFA